MGTPFEFGEMLSLFGEDGIRPVIDSAFKLDAAAEAQRRMEDKKQVREIVLSI